MVIAVSTVSHGKAMQRPDSWYATLVSPRTDDDSLRWASEKGRMKSFPPSGTVVRQVRKHQDSCSAYYLFQIGSFSLCHSRQQPLLPHASRLSEGLAKECVKLYIDTVYICIHIHHRHIAYAHKLLDARVYSCYLESYRPLSMQ